MDGFGLGFRTQHFDYIKSHLPKVDWFEFISENVIEPGGRPREVLRTIKSKYPIVLHGVSLSIGSTDPLNKEYLCKLKSLIDEAQPLWVSDHLCWTGIQQHNSHDLLPLPYTEESLKHVSQRILEVQNFLNRPLLIENPSNYVEFKDSTISEPEFLSELVKKTQCELLIDINNIYVSCTNLDASPREYIKQLPVSSIRQIHLAGHSDYGSFLYDTHSKKICDEVWELYKYACKKFPPIATMIERDDNIPEFEVLFEELMMAKKIRNQIEKEKSRRDPKTILEVDGLSLDQF